MGYNYYILIEGSNGDEWIEIYYVALSGSYSAVKEHYFVDKRHYGYGESKDHFKHNMGDYQYIFTYETIKTDYEKYSKSGVFPETDIKRKFVNFLTQEITRNSLEEIRDYIVEITGSESLSENQITNGALDELTYYYDLCNNYRDKYKEIRIIFGINP